MENTACIYFSFLRGFYQSGSLKLHDRHLVISVKFSFHNILNFLKLLSFGTSFTKYLRFSATVIAGEVTGLCYLSYFNYFQSLTHNPISTYYALYSLTRIQELGILRIRKISYNFFQIFRMCMNIIYILSIFSEELCRLFFSKFTQNCGNFSLKFYYSTTAFL